MSRGLTVKGTNAIVLAGVVLSVGCSREPSVPDELSAIEKDIADKCAKHWSARAEVTIVVRGMGEWAKGTIKAEGRGEFLRQGEKRLWRYESKRIEALGDQGYKENLQLKFVLSGDGDIVYRLEEHPGKSTVCKEVQAPSGDRSPTGIFERMRREYDLKLLPDEKIDGSPVYVIEGRFKSERPEGAAAIMHWCFRKDSGVPVKVIEMAEQGEVYRTTTFSDIELNMDIPPERFTFQIPPGARLDDQTGPPWTTRAPSTQRQTKTTLAQGARITLHEAARTDNAEQASANLSAGCAVDSRSADGKTPLHEAAMRGHLGVAQLLLASGADINAKTDDKRGQTALHLALEPWPGRKPDAGPGVVQLLLAKDADVNARDAFGWTPLELAAEGNDRGLVELLLDRGAEIDATDAGGFTPLHRAIGKEAVGVGELLVGKGADVNARTKDGRTALQMALDHRSIELVTLLIVKGARDVNAQTGDGWTPLHLAAVSGQEVAVQTLLAKGAEVNARKSGGLTALHLAAKGGHAQVVEVLIAKGANVNSKDEDGWTALHSAARDGHKAVVEILLAAGADVNARTKDSRTPLQCAASERHDQVAQLLKEHGAKD